MSMSTGFGTSGRATNWFSVLLAGLAALLCVRLLALYVNGTDLFFDEAQYWAWSQDPALGYFSKPPLIAWIIGAATTACGPEEACVRLPSPLLHTATSLAVFWLGSRLYDDRIGALSALAFATLPGVSLSAGLISTDVPLLLCWALALVGFAALFETDELWPGLLLGAAFGAGLNAKYAMAWFVGCAAVYLFMTPARRAVLRDKRLYLALAIGFLLIAPNLAWNYSHKFATFSHTAENANWGGSLLHPNKALEFFGAQFGVFGPILFGAFLVIVWRARRAQLPEADRLLLAFSVPIIAVIAGAGVPVARPRQLGGDGLRGGDRAGHRHHGARRRLGLAQGLLHRPRHHAGADRLRHGDGRAGAAAAQDRPVRAHARLARSGERDAGGADAGRCRRASPTPPCCRTTAR